MAKLRSKVTSADHIRGSEGAKVTLVEYGDFECPHCATAFSMVKKIEDHYGSKLRFVYRNFPLVDLHPMAEPAAEAAEFAGKHGKYWEMYDAIFEHQRRLTQAMLRETAKALGLDPEMAAQAVRTHEFGERIQRDVDGGKESGVHGTPTFFINGELYEGTWELKELIAAIDQAM